MICQWFNILRNLLWSQQPLILWLRGHLQREERKGHIDVIPAEAYLLQSTEEEKSGISKSDQILKRANQSKEAEILQLCRDASFAECLEMGQFLRSKPAVNIAVEWIQRVAELDRTLSQKGAHTVFRRTRPNTLIGPSIDQHPSCVVKNSGIDVQIPNVDDRAQNCRLIQDHYDCQDKDSSNADDLSRGRLLGAHM